MTTYAIIITFILCLMCALNAPTCSDANYAVDKYMDGYKPDQERVWRAKFGTELMMGVNILFAVLSGFVGLFLLLKPL